MKIMKNHESPLRISHAFTKYTTVS